jgi:hypothetical protein
VDGGHYVAHVRKPYDYSGWLCGDTHISPSTSQLALNAGDCGSSGQDELGMLVKVLTPGGNELVPGQAKIKYLPRPTKSATSLRPLIQKIYPTGVLSAPQGCV